MDDREHDRFVRSEFETPRPASSIPIIIWVALGALALGLFSFHQFSPGDSKRTAVTDSSPRVERAPIVPQPDKTPTDMTTPVPKAPLQ